MLRSEAPVPNHPLDALPIDGEIISVFKDDQIYDHEQGTSLVHPFLYIIFILRQTPTATPTRRANRRC